MTHPVELNRLSLNRQRQYPLFSIKHSDTSEKGVSMDRYQSDILIQKAQTVEWLANGIFQAFPGHITGLKFHLLDCGCIYYQRVFSDGNVDPKIAVYRDPAHGTCEICMMQAVHWRQMVRDVVVAYNIRLEIVIPGEQ